MININIQQSTLNTELVDPEIITKLYEYATVSKLENQYSDLEISLSGKISTPAARKEQVRYLSGIDENDTPKFPNLQIEVLNNGYVMDFESEYVKNKCVRSHGGEINSNNIKGISGEITYALASSVRSIASLFYNDHTVVPFKEFLYFTGIADLGYRTFYNSGITKLIVPEGISSIRTDSFFSMTLLKVLVLPSSLIDIGSIQFGYSTKIEFLIMRATTPPRIESNTFDISSITSTAYIYVPDDSVDLYKSADIWSNYADRIYPVSQLPDGVL